MTDPSSRLTSALADRYDIERKLGEGGMASVYLAHDLRHNRQVAIKVLKPELAAVVGAERFLAEIETTANLQHPNILPLYDSGEADGFLYYVMPYVEGESLRDKLDAEKQLPVDEAVRIATAVANALDFAHSRGVVHRDIKPANILFQGGQPVVGDFGIALALGAGGGARLTETGLSVGTPYYMSPEQATGDQHVGARSDIYSLGCVLYEMLVGDPPYLGSTAQAVLGQIISGKPVNATEHRSAVPAHVDAAIRKALEKVPADRFTTAADLAAALGNTSFRHEGAGRTTRGNAPGAPPPTRAWLSQGASKAAVAAIAVLAIAVALVGSGAFEGPATEAYAPAVVRFELDSTDVTGVEALALSRDGSSVVFQKPDGPTLVYMKLDGSARREWAGASQPVFSPDGRSVLFFGTGNVTGMYRASVDGGSPFEIDVGEAFAAPMDWTRDGSIYYSTLDGFYRLPAGGAPERLLDEGLVTARWFRVLPGGAAGIFTYGAIDAEQAEIRLVDFETGAVRTLIEDGFDAQYLPTGHLVYARFDRALVTVPFDIETRSVGQAVSVMDSLRISRQDARSFFRVSETGTAFYMLGGRDGDEERTSRLLARIDLGGGLTPEPLPPTSLGEVAVSPDGRKVAYIAENKLHVYDLITGTPDRPFDDRVSIGLPRWSPDGSEISVVHLGGGGGLFTTSVGPADGSGPFTTLEAGFPMVAATDFTPDGTRLLAVTFPVDVNGQPDLFVIPRDGGDPVPYLQADWSEEDGAISPDGAWAAYVSDQSDSDRVYVRSFPDPGPPTQISQGTGDGPRWSPSGTTLYYQSPDSVYAAVLSFDSGVTVESRRALFARDTELGRLTDWDVHPDGGFIGVIEPDAPEEEDDEERARIAPARGYVVVNWVEEMLRRVSGGGT